MKILSKCSLVILLFIFLAACSSLLAPNVKTELVSLRGGQYELDPKHTAVLFKVNHMGFSKFIGRFEKVEASLDFDSGHIEKSQLQAIIDMSSVNVNNEKFATTLSGAEWFNAEKYPQAIFISKEAARKEDNLVVFEGELTFLGVSKPVSVAVQFNGGANNLFSGRYTIGFEAHSQFKRSEFGLDKHLAVVGDDIEIEVHAEFVRIR